jgi:hypothetical protein
MIDVMQYVLSFTCYFSYYLSLYFYGDGGLLSSSFSPLPHSLSLSFSLHESHESDTEQAFNY